MIDSAGEPPGNRIDLRGGLTGQVTIVPEEHAEERAVRLRALQRQTLIDDAKNVVTFTVLLVATCALGLEAAYLSFLDSAATPDTKRWAQNILTALMSGGISFVVGHKLGSK